MADLNVSRIVRTLGALGVLAALSGCMTTTAPTVCSMPSGNSLERAMAHTRAELANGCEASFDAYFDSLLAIAEGDPGADNKRQFSEFLTWSADMGVLSHRQSRELYNRYFNVKFVSLLGDYNNCAYTCPKQDALMQAMAQELAHKERGLLRVTEDQSAYYQADRLLKQAELVIAATCQACEAGAR